MEGDYNNTVTFYGLYPQIEYGKYSAPIYGGTIDILKKKFYNQDYDDKTVIFSNIYEITFNYGENVSKRYEENITNKEFHNLGSRINIIIAKEPNNNEQIYTIDSIKYHITQDVICPSTNNLDINPCLIKMVNKNNKFKVFCPTVSFKQGSGYRELYENSFEYDPKMLYHSKDFYEKIIAETKVSFGVYVLEESVKDALRTLNENVAKKVKENESDRLISEIADLKENQRKTSLGTFIDNLKNVVNSGIKQVGIEIMKNDSSTSAKEKREAKAQLISLGIDNLKNSVLANMKLVFNQSKMALLEKQKTELETQNKNLNTQKEAAEAKTKTSNISSVINNLQYLATTQMKQIGNEIRNNNIKTSLGGIEKLNKVTEGIYNILSSKGLTFQWLTT